jgi:hypothetical protein
LEIPFGNDRDLAVSTWQKCTGSAVIELITRQPSLPDGKFKPAAGRRHGGDVDCGSFAGEVSTHVPVAICRTFIDGSGVRSWILRRPLINQRLLRR